MSQTLWELLKKRKGRDEEKSLMVNMAEHRGILPEKRADGREIACLGEEVFPKLWQR